MLGGTTVDVLVYTGEESPWQPPREVAIGTQIPNGVSVVPGARFVVRHVHGTGSNTNPWRFVWDAPPPELPPMQFPQVPGGQDPLVMLDHLQSLVATGALSQEGYDRAAAYLERGRQAQR